MKRLHLHLSVDDLEQSTRFYSALFGVEPGKKKSDYARWILDDPCVNFAISARGAEHGLDHLGIQVDEDDELSELRQRLQQADLSLFDEGETTCCYARSDKTWVQDPAGIAWEAYRTMAEAEMFNQQSAAGSACCAAEAGQEVFDQHPEPATGCCAPKADTGTGCC